VLAGGSTIIGPNTGFRLADDELCMSGKSQHFAAHVLTVQVLRLPVLRWIASGRFGSSKQFIALLLCIELKVAGTTT
jgi:hypothetical protein